MFFQKPAFSKSQIESTVLFQKPAFSKKPCFFVECQPLDPYAEVARVEAEREDARAQCDNLALELQLARADNQVLKVKKKQ